MFHGWQVRWSAACAAALMAASAGAAPSSAPSAAQALRLTPLQAGVDYDRPEAESVSACTIGAKKIGNEVGWFVDSPNGLTLRRFSDTNSDNIVDQWSYYKDGLEVYRDIDADFNGKADQYRWFNTAGCRWGLDPNEDGKIDSWKVISAEEVAAEMVGALVEQDADRFSRLLLTAEELQSLKLGPDHQKLLAERMSGAAERFKALMGGTTGVTRTMHWVGFSGSQPGIVPAGTGGSTQDVRVYENSVALVEDEGKNGQIQVGTLIQVGDVWRLVDAPQPATEDKNGMLAGGIFFQPPTAASAIAGAGGTNEQAERLLDELQNLDQQGSQDYARRTELLLGIAEEAGSPEDRAMWYKQLADMLSSAVQQGAYPDGVNQLQALFDKLQKDPADRDLAGSVKFDLLTASYGLAMQAQDPDFAKLQDEWLKNLEQYVADYPTSPDASEAMLQLAMNEEYGGTAEKAAAWYARIAKDFPETSAGRKAAGAVRRIDSVGKTIQFQGRGVDGKPVSLADFRGKIVLLHFWATWNDQSTTDLAVLKDLLARYGRYGFTIVSVSLDADSQQLAAYLNENRLSWPQVFEEGGLDSAPANSLGILSVPTMLLMDPQGRVVNRSLQSNELEGELKKLVRVADRAPAPAAR